MTEDERKAWLSGLKAGDEVFAMDRVRKVGRTTPAMIVLARDKSARYHRRNGALIGRPSWSSESIWPVNDHNRLLDLHRRAIRMMEISSRGFGRLNADQCRAIIDTLKAAGVPEEDV